MSEETVRLVVEALVNEAVVVVALVVVEFPAMVSPPTMVVEAF